tara:strand:+ start:466 stop:591 length:126 start_codon:yes stop_codon:yes gene_type:complete
MGNNSLEPISIYAMYNRLYNPSLEQARVKGESIMKVLKAFV